MSDERKEAIKQALEAVGNAAHRAAEAEAVVRRCEDALEEARRNQRRFLEEWGEVQRKALEDLSQEVTGE